MLTAKDTISKADARLVHPVHCPICHEPFDLFASAWCGHATPEATKLCPSCGKCVCEEPGYSNPTFWTDAPGAFQKIGFSRLFLLYI